MMTKLTVVLVSLFALILVGCESSETPTAQPTSTPTPNPIVEEPFPDPLFVETLGDWDRTGPVFVVGHLVITERGAKLCSVLLESFPPQCGGVSVGLDGVERLDAPLKTEQNVSWTDNHTSVWGYFEDGRILVFGEEPSRDPVEREVTGPAEFVGNLWVRGDEVRLCSVMAASIPPLCSSPYTEVFGVDELDLQHFDEYDDIHWSPGERSIRGVLVGSRLYVLP